MYIMVWLLPIMVYIMVWWLTIIVWLFNVMRLLLPIMVFIIVWWLPIMEWLFNVIRFNVIVKPPHLEHLVVFVLLQCVIVFIRILMRRFMHMLHDGLSPEILIALIARERWRLSAAAAA